MKLLFLIFLYASFKLTESLDDGNDPVVVTPRGTIRGIKENDGNYTMYLGIPFAKVDKNNPFGPATKQPRFKTIYNANNDSIICPQLDEITNKPAGSLDCLQLNVYVPHSASPTKQLPVLIWIFGGGFSVGSAGRFIYGPKFIIKHDVILVTINYRLGPYGFMCLNIPTVPGNQGLKDQLLGLKWVTENIGAFGGNVNQITLFGESAGASSVDHHLLSPHRKLFNKIILESGSAFGSWSISKPNLELPIKICRELNYNTTDIKDAVSYLTNTDPIEVIRAANNFEFEYSPCIENSFKGVDRFIKDYPSNLKSSNIHNTPILLGFNSDEAVYIHGNQKEEYFDKFQNFFEERLQRDFVFDNENELHDRSKLVRNFYIGDEPIDINAKQGFIDFDTDFLFTHPAFASINKYMEQCSGDIFLYMFSYNGGRNFFKNFLNLTTNGASHADELGYLFEQSFTVGLDIAPDDQKMIDIMTTLWTNFAKYSNPTPKESDLLPVKWLPVTSQALNYLNIDKQMKLARMPFKERTAFWNLFYYANKKFYKGNRH